MDFIDEVKALAVRIPGLLEHIKNEAATRTALVEPFIRALGYDTSNPAEVLPEFGANLDLPGVNKDKHVDYGIMKDGKPIILIEVKPYGKDPSVGIGQLYDYFNKVDARFAIATNGVIYRFYTDLEKRYLLDPTPFLEIDLLNLNESLAEELKKLTKPVFDVDGMVTTAEELKFVGGILKILAEQVNKTDENFAKYFFQRLCPDRAFAGAVKPQFAAFTQKALKQFITEEIKRLLDVSTGAGSSRSSTPASATEETGTEDVVSPADLESNKQIITTAEELEGFYIVKSILRETVDPGRITQKDVAKYFNVLLDGKVNKPICRFYFNNPKNRRLELFNPTEDGKSGEMTCIDNLNDIYKYANRMKAIVAYYNSK
jgi:hypothetical protein